MFFYVSKILWALTAPTTFLILLGLAGLLLSRWWRRTGITIAAVGLLGLLIGGASPLATALSLPLEDRFPPFVDDGRPVEGIVVLGGAEVGDVAAVRGQPTFNEAGERFLALAQLSRRYPQARILFAGGNGSIFEGPSEADMVRAALPGVGVSPDRVAFEDRSRNTAENARFAKEIVQPKPGERWLLVTSAFHMPRAVGCFRAAGFPVTAFPVDYRTTGPADLWSPFFSVSTGLWSLDIAVREWVGLVAYYLTGRTPALFPAP